MKCRIIPPSSSDACGKTAIFRVRFLDGDRAPACEGCKMYLEQLSQSHGRPLDVERLEKDQA